MHKGEEVDGDEIGTVVGCRSTSKRSPITLVLTVFVT
jgi:hypothetical protein